MTGRTQSEFGVLPDSKCASGKIRYATEDRAIEVRRILRRKGHTDLTGVYICSKCDGWHITSARMVAGRTR